MKSHGRISVANWVCWTKGRAMTILYRKYRENLIKFVWKKDRRFLEKMFPIVRGKNVEKPRRWRVREHSPPSFGLRRGGATPGVVSSAACAVILARSFFGSGVGAHSSYNSSRINKPFFILFNIHVRSSSYSIKNRIDETDRSCVTQVWRSESHDQEWDGARKRHSNPRERRTKRIVPLI